MVSRFDAELALQALIERTVEMQSRARLCVEKRDIGHCDFAEMAYQDARPLLKQIRAYVRGR